MDKNYGAVIFFQNVVLLRKPEIPKFADSIKSTIMSTKAILKNSIKAKRITNYVLKCNFYFIFPIKQKKLISGE